MVYRSDNQSINQSMIQHKLTKVYILNQSIMNQLDKSINKQLLKTE